MIGIYKITNPIGESYIGQSVDIENRWKQYRKYFAESQPKLKMSFFKYGIDNHRFEILKECLVQEINALEMYYIHIDGKLNCSKGSDGIKKKKLLRINTDLEIIKRVKTKIVLPLKDTQKLNRDRINDYTNIIKKIFSNKKIEKYLTSTEIKIFIEKSNPAIKIQSMVYFGRALKTFFGKSVCKRINNKNIYCYPVSLL